MPTEFDLDAWYARSLGELGGLEQEGNLLTEVTSRQAERLIQRGHTIFVRDWTEEFDTAGFFDDNEYDVVDQLTSTQLHDYMDDYLDGIVKFWAYARGMSFFEVINQPDNEKIEYDSQVAFIDDIVGSLWERIERIDSNTPRKVRMSQPYKTWRIGFTDAIAEFNRVLSSYVYSVPEEGVFTGEEQND